MITEHIQRYQQMTDADFIHHAQFYRRFKGVTTQEHLHNINYITERAQNLGYNFTAGCCNKFYLNKLDK